MISQYGILAMQERDYVDKHMPEVPIVTTEMPNEDPVFWWVYQNGICIHGPFHTSEEAHAVLDRMKT